MAQASAKAAKMDRIIEEGRLLLAKDGLGFSMRELARNAGFGGVSSLYRYVDNRRELWFAVVNHDFGQWGQEVRKIRDDPEFADSRMVLRQLCLNFLQFSRQDFDKFRIMLLMPPPESDSEPGTYESNHHPEIYNAFVDTVKLGRNRGEIKPDEPPEMQAGIIWSMLLGAATSVSPLYDYTAEEIYTDEIGARYSNIKLALHYAIIDRIENMFYIKDDWMASNPPEWKL